MKEAAFQAWVVDVAKRFGWHVWHVPMPMRPLPGGGMVAEPRAKGLPDLIMLHDRPPRLIFAELKGTGGKLSEEQKEFLRLARGVVQTFTDYIVMAQSLNMEPLDMRVPMGVYAWGPGAEDIIEAVLRGSVLS